MGCRLSGIRFSLPAAICPLPAVFSSFPIVGPQSSVPTPHSLLPAAIWILAAYSCSFRSPFRIPRSPLETACLPRA
jgi:hypothetical protein